MSRIPAGSRPVFGSSSRSSCGRRKSEAAMPSRCRIPCGVPAEAVARPVGQVDRLENLTDPVARPAAVEGRQQLQVAAAGQVGVEPRRLHEAGHAVERAGPVEERIAPEQPSASLGRADQPQEHPQRRGLAGPVRPQVAVDVATLDGQVDMVDRGQVAVALDQTPRDDRCGVARRAVLHETARAAASAAAAGSEPITV